MKQKFGAQINSVSQLKGRAHTVVFRSRPNLAKAARHIRSIEPPLELRSYIATRKILHDVIERLIWIGDWPGAVLLD